MGAAAGIIQPLSQAIVLDLYPKQEHGRMLAIWGATIMAGPILDEAYERSGLAERLEN